MSFLMESLDGRFQNAYVVLLSLSRRRSHREGGDAAAVGDGAILLLVLGDVISQCLVETLGVQGIQDHSGADLSLRRARHHLSKVDDELIGRVGDNGEVAVLALCHFVADFDIQLVFRIVFHGI